MAKRFTDTNKLKKKWLRGMQAPYKLLWVYLLDACDHAGIWEVDFEIANIYVGGGVVESKCIELFNDKIYIFDDGDKWLIRDFIDFQYNGLNENNPAHKNVIKQLNKYGLLNVNLTLNIDNKQSPYKAPIKGTKEKEEETVKVKVKVEEKEEEIIYPFQTENFKKYWNLWKEYKKKEHNFRYKSSMSEQAALKKISEISNMNEVTAIEIIVNSISNGYKGLFALKEKHSNSIIPKSYKQQILDELEN